MLINDTFISTKSSFLYLIHYYSIYDTVLLQYSDMLPFFNIDILLCLPLGLFALE